MSKEYIEHEAIIKLSKEIQDNFAPLHRKVIEAFIYNIDKNIPVADVEPVRHGEWREEFRSQKSPDGYFYWNAPQKKIYVCSICGREEIKKEPYCNCGAKMDGGNK